MPLPESIIQQKSQFLQSLFHLAGGQDGISIPFAEVTADMDLDEKSTRLIITYLSADGLVKADKMRGRVSLTKDGQFEARRSLKDEPPSSSESVIQESSTSLNIDAVQRRWKQGGDDVLNAKYNHMDEELKRILVYAEGIKPLADILATLRVHPSYLDFDAAEWISNRPMSATFGGGQTLGLALEDEARMAQLLKLLEQATKLADEGEYGMVAIGHKTYTGATQFQVAAQAAAEIVAMPFFNYVNMLLSNLSHVSLRQVNQSMKKNSAFIIMWMDSENPSLDDVHAAIKDTCREFGIDAKRADEVEHQDVITEVVLERIRTSEYVIADLTGERPNVYYELGYAHALGIKPILYRRKDTVLHFDLSVHNVPEYRNISDLKTKLRSRLEVLTGRVPG